MTTAMLIYLVHLLLLTLQNPGTQTATRTIEKGDFRFSYDERGISGLANPHDPFGAILMPAAAAGGGRGQGAPAGRGRQAGGAAVLGLSLSYRVANEGDWTNLTTRRGKWSASPEAGTVTYANDQSNAPLKVVETYKTDGNVLDWTIDVETTHKTAVRIGDLGISVPAAGPSGEDPVQIFERGFLRHQFISGSGSFFYFVRASGAPPFLLVTVRPGTKLEYTAGGGGRGGAQVYVHSSRTGGAETRGT